MWDFGKILFEKTKLWKSVKMKNENCVSCEKSFWSWDLHEMLGVKNFLLKTERKGQYKMLWVCEFFEKNVGAKRQDIKLLDIYFEEQIFKCC